MAASLLVDHDGGKNREDAPRDTGKRKSEDGPVGAPAPKRAAWGEEAEAAPTTESNAKDVELQEVADESRTTISTTEPGQSEVRTTKALPSIRWSEAPQLLKSRADRLLRSFKCEGDGLPSGQRQIFVFGSNTEGRHGKGAALLARQRYGAKLGVAQGLVGSGELEQIFDLLLDPLNRDGALA